MLSPIGLKLLRMNYKVAVAEQVEDASLAKGLVKRDLTKVMSPGCIEQLEGLKSDSPNYIMALYEEPSSRVWAVLIADLSTGELRMSQCLDNRDLKQLISSFAPKRDSFATFLSRTNTKYFEGKEFRAKSIINLSARINSKR